MSFHTRKLCIFVGHCIGDVESDAAVYCGCHQADRTENTRCRSPWSGQAEGNDLEITELRNVHLDILPLSFTKSSEYCLHTSRILAKFAYKLCIRRFEFMF